MHRIALLLTPLLMSSILGGCLFSTKTDKLVQQVRISTDPSRGYVWQLEDGKKKPLGYAPTNLRVPYESTTEGINPAWWWTSIGLASAASATSGIFGYGTTDNEAAKYAFYGSLGVALGSMLVFYFIDASLKAKGSTLSESREIQLIAARDGYLEQKATLTVPSKQRSLRIALPPDPDKAHLRAKIKPRQPKLRSKPIVTPAVTPAGPKPIVAVFDVRDESKRFKKNVTEQLTEYLAASLTATGRFQVVPRDQLRKRLSQEKRASYRKCYDESCQLEMGKALAAEKTLTTKLLRVGDRCAIVATLYDLKTETTDKSALEKTNCSANELMELMDKITKTLAQTGDTR